MIRIRSIANAVAIALLCASPFCGAGCSDPATRVPTPEEAASTPPLATPQTADKGSFSAPRQVDP